MEVQEYFITCLGHEGFDLRSRKDELEHQLWTALKKEALCQYGLVKVPEKPERTY